MPTQYFLSTIKIADIVDVAIVSYIVYKVLVFFKNTRAYQLLKAIAILLVAAQLSEIMNLMTINFLLKNTLQLGLIAVVIIFQPELRSALAKIGSKRFMLFNSDVKADQAQVNIIASQIKNACVSLTEMRYGALIAIEKNIHLDDVVKVGTVLNSEVSSELLINIFIPNTPLHDGAVVISENKIKSAACFLPLSQNESLSKELGTRHRAGLGLSESTDALVIIVSEETGKISVAYEGTLTRNLSPSTLEKVLIKTLTNEHNQISKRKKTRRSENEEKA